MKRAPNQIESIDLLITGNLIGLTNVNNIDIIDGNVHSDVTLVHPQVPSTHELPLSLLGRF